MIAHEAAPTGAARGGVVVVQEAFGVTTHIESICDRLAAEGFHCVAPALFHRQGSPVLAYDDLASVMPIMQQLTRGGIDEDLAEAISVLGERGFPPAQVGVVGFCMGGSVSFFAAASRPLGAAVTFYGGGIVEGRFGSPPLLEQAATLETPWLGLFGSADKGIPVEQVEALRAAVALRDVDTEVVVYDGAQHGFNCDDRPAVFDPAASADGMARTVAWFAEHLAA